MLSRAVIVRSISDRASVVARALVATLVPPSSREMASSGALSDGRTRAVLQQIRRANGRSVMLSCARGLDRLGRVFATRMGWPAAQALLAETMDEAPRRRAHIEAVSEAARLFSAGQITEEELHWRACAANEYRIDDAITARALDHRARLPWLEPLIRDEVEPVGASDEPALIGDRWIATSWAQGVSAHEYAQHSANARAAGWASLARLRDERAYKRALRSVLTDVVVTADDCGTEQRQRVRSTRAAGLVLGEDARAADGSLVLARGTLLSERSVALLVARAITHVAARTPLGCEASEGVCARCYGANAVDRSLVAVGTRAGLRSSRALEAQAAALATATFMRVIC